MPPHLPGEEQPCLVVAPVTVVEVPSDDEKVDLLFNCQTDEPVKGLSGSGSHSFGCVTFVASQSLERAVKVNVGGVQEAKGPHHSISLVCLISVTITRLIPLEGLQVGIRGAEHVAVCHFSVGPFAGGKGVAFAISLDTTLLLLSDISPIRVPAHLRLF